MGLTKTLFSTEFKVKVILEAITGEKTIDEIARAHKIHPDLLSDWTKAFLNMSSLVLDNHSNNDADIQTKLQDLLKEQDYEYSEYVFFKAVLDHTTNIANICDLETHKILYVNQACKDMYGFLEDEDFKAKTCYELFYNATAPCDFCTSEELVRNGRHQWKTYNPVLKRHYALSDYLLKLDGRDIRLQIGVDIHKAENQLIELDNKITLNQTLFDCIRTLTETTDLKQAIEEMLKIVCTFHDGNRGYIFECSEDNTLLNNTYEWCREGVSAEIDNLQNVPIETAADWFTHFEESGDFSISNLAQDLDEDSADRRILTAQGIESLIVAPLIDDGVVKGFIGVDDPRKEVNNFSLLKSVTYFVLNDIQKRRLIAELEKISYIDTLTQLYNRNKYIKVLAEMEKRPPHTLGVVFIDLNGLKVANDRFGHDYGDYLLKQLSDILRNIFNCDIYRVGGDEFVVLCANIERPVFESKVVLLRRAVAHGDDFTASVGTTWDGKNPNIYNLIKHADDLMYANKQQYYQTIEVVDYNHNSALAKQLLNDISEGKFQVFLQPKIDLSNNSLCGAEALIRGSDKDGNLVPPDSFIPIYEANGIIRHIDFFVLETVCKLINDLKKQGHDIKNISVNFSRVTLLEHNVVDHMRLICQKYNIPPSQITIEVTESTAKLQIEELISLVYKIKDTGFDISLDDYGTKYSNMTTLTSIGFDEIKLDRSIVSGLTINSKTRTIIEHTIKMLKDLKMCKVVAEGIETVEELDILKHYGCDYGQGFHFSRPIPIGQFVKKYFSDITSKMML